VGPFAYNNPVAAGWLRPTARSMISTAGALMDEFSPKNLATTSQPEQPPQPVESPASFYANPQAMHPQTELIYTQVVLPDRGPSSEVMRVKLAWAKMLWLLGVLGSLLAIAYLLPFVIGETNYSATRRKR